MFIPLHIPFVEQVVITLQLVARASLTAHLGFEMSGLIETLILFVGVLTAISANWSWYLPAGREFGDSPPNEVALSLRRLFGVIITIIALAVLSSCFIANPYQEWPQQFHDRLSNGEVKEITIERLDGL